MKEIVTKSNNTATYSEMASSSTKEKSRETLTTTSNSTLTHLESFSNSIKEKETIAKNKQQIIKEERKDCNGEEDFKIKSKAF